MKYDIVTAGFPLVEIMRKERGIAFTEPGDFAGPYPSGDTCIVLDVAARYGKKCCFLGVVGDDPFGRVILNRLCEDGIDVSHVRVDREHATAAVFVRYEKDGVREYMDFINNSACSTLCEADIAEEAIKAAAWVHFSGEIISCCAAGQRRRAIEKMLALVSPESRVSLDPNFTVDIRGMEELFQPFIQRADLILPSEGEAKVLMNTENDEEACKLLAARGKIVALKKGSRGCDIYRGDSVLHVEAYPVEEIDPTGCGDSFSAGFITGLLSGWDLYKCGCLANAAGAMQAGAFGPMEGAGYLREAEEFMRKQECERKGR